MGPQNSYFLTYYNNAIQIHKHTHILMARNDKQNIYYFKLNREESGNQTNNISGENALGDGNNRLPTFSLMCIFSGSR